MSSPSRGPRAVVNRPPPRPLPPFELPEQLPVSARAADIIEAIAGHQVVVISGETGSGKTTQLPKLAWLAGQGRAGLIGHTQPRRIAASTVAKRIAAELGTPLGEHVGYKVRFAETVQPGAAIKLMTDGILLAESQHDPLLSAYDTLIIDEAHERSLNIDFLLGYLQGLLKGARRDDLKLIITSATIDAQRFAKHFEQPGRPVPVIEVSGRMYPVEIRYRNYAEHSDEDEETDTPSHIEDAIEELWREAPGDVLVFLPGERDIREVADHLQRAIQRARSKPAGSGGPLARGPVEILPLYSRLSTAEQDRVFSSSNAQRIVLATNVAETSLTVPGIRYVVDTGLARVKRYRYRGKVEELHIEPISQAAANQRSGRCGRVSNGVCIRLFDETHFQGRARFTDPEVLRSSLAGVILRMRSLGLGEVEAFAFLDPPPRRAIIDGLDLLHELDAINAQRELTHIGVQLARLPLDPRIGRMLLAAQERDCVREMLIIAAGLASQDARERPMHAQQAADQAHKRFADERSDFVSWVKLWDYWRGLIESRNELGLSHRQLAQRLEREFLSNRKLREWADVHQQLEQTVRELGWRINTAAPTPEALHRALLTGLLGNLGTKAADDTQYSGSHSVKFVVHPGSHLARKAPRWLMAAELVDTGRLLARTVAAVEATWIEAASHHLMSKSHSEPHWSKKSGQAMIYERGTLYGLTVYSQRRVPLAPLDAKLARELLIREALVQGQWPEEGGKLPDFVVHNRKLIEQVQALEHKIRRPDLLVDEQFLVDWFDQRVPPDVVSTRGLLAAKPDLKLEKNTLLRKDDALVDHLSFPKRITMFGLQFDATYLFDPGSPEDGVTLTVPLQALNQVDAQAAQWLVPGMLRDKVVALLKGLPQRLRRHFVPLPKFAEGFVAGLGAERPAQSLEACVIAYAREQGLPAPQLTDFHLDQLPAHLLMRFKLVDEHGRVLGASRSLQQLRSEFGGQALNAFQSALAGALTVAPVTQAALASPASSPASSAASSSFTSPVSTQAEPSERFTRWTFGPLPELMELKQGGSTLIGYPALVDETDAVSLQVFDDPLVARRTHQAGLRRLFAIDLREPLKFFEKSVPDFTRLSLGYRRFGEPAQLREDLQEALLNRACLEGPWPEDQAAFEEAARAARTRLNLLGQSLVRGLQLILDEFGVLEKKLNATKAAPAVVADIEHQLQWVLPKRFVRSLPAERWQHVPRYLKAAVMRLDKLREDPVRDAELSQSMQPLAQQWQRRWVAAKGEPDAELIDFGWQLQELRVSLFAQGLRTPAPVSVKRLEKAWASLIGR